MSQLVYVVIPERPRVAAEGDILFRTFANRSRVPGFTISTDAEIDFPLITNVSVLNHWRITEGVEPDLDFPHIANSSTVPGFTISEAPADENLEFTLLVNDSVVIPFTISESPPDENLEFTLLVNSSTVPGFVVQEDTGESDDDDGSIGGAPIGGGSI